MLFATIEDFDSSMEILVFPKILEATESIWKEENIILVNGKVSDKDGVYKILADKVKLIGQKELEYFKRISLTQNKNGFHSNPPFSVKNPEIVIIFPPVFDKAVLKKMSDHFKKCDPGTAKIYLVIGNSRLETPYRVKETESIREIINKILPEGRVEIS